MSSSLPAVIGAEALAAFDAPGPMARGLTSTAWVHREDHEMCERLQQGRASEVAAGGGVLSPVWEDSVRTFQGFVVGSLR